MRYLGFIVAFSLLSGCSKTVINGPIVQGQVIDKVYEGVLPNPPVVKGIVSPSSFVKSVSVKKGGLWIPVDYHINAVHYSILWDIIFPSELAGCEYQIVVRIPE